MKEKSRRAKLYVEDYESEDPICRALLYLARKHGVEVLGYHVPACYARAREAIGGWYTVGRKEIVVLLHHPVERQRHTLAHELAHHVLHADKPHVDRKAYALWDGPYFDAIEGQANRFADKLLALVERRLATRTAEASI